MAQATQKSAELSTDDRVRMRRLSEEVQGRLQEMAPITSRTLDIPIGSDSVIKFAPQMSSRQSADGETVLVIEIICGPDGCVCYVDLPGVCEPC